MSEPKSEPIEIEEKDMEDFVMKISMGVLQFD